MGKVSNNSPLTTISLKIRHFIENHLIFAGSLLHINLSVRVAFRPVGARAHASRSYDWFDVLSEA